MTALVYEGPLLSVLAEGHVADAAGQDNDGDVVGGCPVGGEDVELVALADGAEDGLAALEEALIGLISEEEDDDRVLQLTRRIKYHLDLSKITDFDLNHN